MPKPCYPICSDKRDFMEVKLENTRLVKIGCMTLVKVNPPRSESDFYSHYDPMVGVGTAIVLLLFFITITIKSCIRYGIRKWNMYHFYKNIDKQQSSNGIIEVEKGSNENGNITASTDTNEDKVNPSESIIQKALFKDEGSMVISDLLKKAEELHRLSNNVKRVSIVEINAAIA